MKLDHRPLRAEDVESICAFAQSTEELFFMFPQATFPLTPDQVREAARLSHDPTVAVMDGRVAGYVDFGEVQAKQFCALGNLAVSPGYRSREVAAYLVGAMVQSAMTRYAVRFVRASCFSHDKAAYQLLHEFGFRPADLAQRLGPDGEPVLLVHLHLHRSRWPEPPGRV